jgi:hypothetical protein
VSTSARMGEPVDGLREALADRYHVERELGAGGMATVFLAHDPRHNRAMSRDHPDSRGISLTTESAGNVPFYQRLGYRMVGHGRIGPGLETWGFFRPD